MFCLIKVDFKLFAAGFFALMLSACGGGGGAPAPATGAAAVSVGAFVSTQASATGVGLEYHARVHLSDWSATGPTISNATVLVNGTTLAYESNTHSYSGLVMPHTNGMHNLTVTTAAGDVITASTSAITALPVLVIPDPFSAAVSNTVTWSAPVGMGPSVVNPVYRMTLTRAAAPAYTRYAPVTDTAARFGAGCCSPGAHTAQLAAESASFISGAAPFSLFTVSTSVQTNVNVIQ